MAKDKEFEKAYKAERYRRAFERKTKRKVNKKYRFNRRHKECPDCGGLMRWCSGCEMWTKTCCVDYGTCMCS